MKIILMMGCSGSGKSRWISENVPGAVVLSADHAMADADGVYRFDSAKLAEAHRTCLRKYTDKVSDEFFDHPETLVVDNTNCSAIELAPYVALAQAYNHELRLVCMRCPPDVAFARSQHNCPIETIEFMVAKLMELLDRYPPWWPLPEHVYTV